jgi:predicted nicotinamide N-methyase
VQPGKAREAATRPPYSIGRTVLELLGTGDDVGDVDRARNVVLEVQGRQLQPVCMAMSGTGMVTANLPVPLVKWINRV